MSLRKTLRSRFRGDKSEERNSPKGWHDRSLSDSSGKDELFEVVDSEKEDEKLYEGSHPVTNDNIVREFGDRHVFEQQLIQLQEQLVGVMIENQNLQSELNQVKERSFLDKLRKELDYEKKRCLHLEDKCKSLLKKKKKRKSPSPDSDSGHDKPKTSDTGSITTENAIEDDTEWTVIEIDARPAEEKKPVDNSKQSVLDRVWVVVMSIVYEILDDLTELPRQDQNEDPEADTLSPTKLKDNIKRFGAACRPYVNTVKGFHDLVTWKNPPYTLIAFIVYMYSVYKGWFLPVVLFCFVFRLFISYLRYRGWNINFNFFDPGEEEKDTDDMKDLKVSAKFNLVLLVARKAQNILGFLADSLEKIKNLFIWRQPSATKEIFFKLVCASILSSIFPANYLFYFAGLYFGIKLFIIDYLYLRFPRLKQKYDSTHKIWLSLPTDSEYEKQHLKSEMDKYILPKRDNSEEQETDGILYGVSTEDKTFCEIFSLPLEECPLPDWHGGRRCTLINRDKLLPSAFKNGKLFLTRSFLCFEKTKSPSPTNMVIPLSDITKLEKAKPYSWMPGGGMAIEIAVQGSDKKTIFGAIINRDEVYESIIKAGKSAGLHWASQSDNSSTEVTCS